MKRETIQTILEIKTVLLEQQSQSVADIRAELKALEEMRATIRDSLAVVADAGDCVANMQASQKWRSAQADRLTSLSESITAVTERLHTAEEDLKLALAEERAIKHLNEHHDWAD